MLSSSLLDVLQVDAKAVFVARPGYSRESFGYTFATRFFPAVRLTPHAPGNVVERNYTYDSTVIVNDRQPMYLYEAH